MHSSGFWAQYLGKIGSALRPNSINWFRNIAIRLNTSFGTNSRSWKSAGSVHSLKKNSISFRFQIISNVQLIFTFRLMLRHVATISYPKCFHPLVQSTYTLHHPKSIRNVKLVGNVGSFFAAIKLPVSISMLQHANVPMDGDYICVATFYMENTHLHLWKYREHWMLPSMRKFKKKLTWRRSPTAKTAI